VHAAPASVLSLKNRALLVGLTSAFPPASIELNFRKGDWCRGAPVTLDLCRSENAQLLRVRMFVDEAKSMVRLAHANIARVTSSGWSVAACTGINRARLAVEITSASRSPRCLTWPFDALRMKSEKPPPELHRPFLKAVF